MIANYPLSYLKLHWPNIRSMGWAALRNANPVTRPKALPALPLHMESRVDALPNGLIDDYAAWAGAPASRYASTVPLHLCSQWAMPMLAELGRNAPYNLLSLLNQGLRMQVHSATPRNEALHLVGTLMDVTEEPDRVRIHTRIEAFSVDGQPRVTLDSYSTVPRGRPQKKAAQPKRKEPEFTTVGHWNASEDDGLRFAMLTGDFNPIHTLKAVGKRTRFKGCILHGFGQLARSLEALHNGGHFFSDLDVRWIKPLPLPSNNLSVQVAKVADAEGYLALRVLSEGADVHMVGRFKPAGDDSGSGDEPKPKRSRSKRA